MIERIRERATYANVMASIAVFLAVGGTSYAAMALPRNSVGDAQLKPRSVGSDEVRTSAIGSRAIKDRGIRAGDLSRSARDSLAGQPGPAGPPGPAGASAIDLRASVNAAGGLVAGNATASAQLGIGRRAIGFPRSVAGCTPVATIAKNPGGGDVDPGPAHLVVTVEGDRVVVETYRADGTPSALPFNLIVAC